MLFSLGLCWAVPRASVFFFFFFFFRVNEAFPAAFSGSLNLMKLRPFQLVSQASLVSSRKRTTNEAAAAAGPHPKKLRLLIFLRSFFSTFLSAFFRCTLALEQSAKCNESAAHRSR